jgi:iron complex outermembrane receptor protein
MQKLSNPPSKSLRLTRAAFLAAGAIPLSFPALAHAEEAAAAATNLSADAAEDASSTIVVTASRRRQENIQDVPVAISAIGAEQLERSGTYALSHIQYQVPSLQVFSFNPRNTNINIRGLGSNVSLTNDGLENGVGFYIDNVYYGRVGLTQFDLVDLQSVEVLRGPQGTLFGKNTTAGVINVTSKKPSFDPEFSGEASVGSKGFYQIRGSVSAPIVADKIAFRLSGAISENNGFLYNKTQDTRAQNYYNATIRGQLLFQPSDDFSLRIIGDYSRQKQDHVLGVIQNIVGTYADGTPIANNFVDRVKRFPGYQLAAPDVFARVGESDSHYQSNMKGYGISAEANWKLGDVNLTSITAYRWWDWDPANDGDNTSLPVFVFAQTANRQRQFSQELRAAYDNGGPVNFVVGAYYFWQTVKGHSTLGFGSAAPLWYLPTLPPALANAALDGFIAENRTDPITRSLAFFGQANWKLTDQLTLTAGLRYTHEKKTGTFDEYHTAGADLAGFSDAERAIILGARNNFFPVKSFDTRLSDNSLGGLISLAWKPTNDLLLYGTYSRGNKSGGLNLAILPAGVDPDVKPEKVDSFEIGLKTQFLDRRGTFNLAGFWTETTNYQGAIVELDPVFRQYIANIPKVRSRGIEAELNFALSDRLGLNGGVAYTDAKFVDYTNAPQALEYAKPGAAAVQDLSGRQLPGVPKWTWNIGADANVPVGDWGGKGVQLYAHADYAHRSTYNTTESLSIYGQVPGYGVANARLGLRTDDGLIDLSVWVKNLFDKDYFTSLQVQNIGLITSPSIGEPRTVGVTLRTKL